MIGRLGVGLHGPSIRGRAWADRGPLLLAALVVALATLLASAVPPAMRRVADEAVVDAVVQAGARAAVVVTAPFEPEDPSVPRTVLPNSAAIVQQSADVARFRLGPDLTRTLRPPVASVTSTELEVTGDRPGRTFRLVYLAGADGGDARVTWTAGGPPPAGPRGEQAQLTGPDPWPVQVGLSEATATLLGLAPGDRVPVRNALRQPLDVWVSGIFRPVDPDDPAWVVAPQILNPKVWTDGLISTTELAGLMSSDSLPDGRLAVDEYAMRVNVTFVADPGRFRLADAQKLAATIAELKTTSGTSSRSDTSLKWESGLDAVLRAARAQVAAASAQASVLLIGLLATAALVLLLAAELLVRRRAAVLAGTRMRGASLFGIGVELVIESAAVTLAGGAIGLLIGRLLAGGLSWLWPVPVALVSVLAGPVLGVRAAARATRTRQAPANRSARLAARRTGQLRRVALEALVLLAAAGAFAALHQRGVLPDGPDATGRNLLPALAPTLGAVAGALALLRLLPLGLSLVLARASRGRGALPLLGAARAAATAARALPFLVLVLATALGTFTLAVAATSRAGQDQGAGQSVGADAKLELTPSASVPTLARRISAAAGVDQAVPARVADSVAVTVSGTTAYVRLVVVDAVAFRRLLASTGQPDAPQLARLAGGSGGSGRSGVRALLRSSDPAVRSAKTVAVKWNDATVPATVVGVAEPVGDGTGDVLIVDAAAFAAAGAVADPNTVWASGPGAAAAVTADAGPAGVVTVRTDVLAARRSAPLAAGLLKLAYTGTAVLLVLALLGVALGAAAGAPARGETLARLRTLGLRPGEARRVATGELLPAVIAGALGGTALGVLLAFVSFGRLDLRLLTGQAEAPAVVVPGWTAVPVVLLVLAVGVVVAVESSQARRERLGQVLRAGNS